MHRLVRTTLSALACTLLWSAHAQAGATLGAEAGIVKQSADSPNNFKPGFGFGAHIEVDPIPLLKVGPYYLHYELADADSPAPDSADASFNVLGIHARFILPLPGKLKPYAHAGIGYDRLNLSIDGAYRFVLTSGGDFTEFTGPAIIGGRMSTTQPPKGGWSILVGASIDL